MCFLRPQCLLATFQVNRLGIERVKPAALARCECEGASFSTSLKMARSGESFEYSAALCESGNGCRSRVVQINN